VIRQQRGSAGTPHSGVGRDQGTQSVRYDVVIVGYKLNAAIKPAQALHTLLGLDLEAAKALTREFPTVVMSGLSLSRAESVRQQLSEYGAKVELREQGSANEAPPVPSHTASAGYELGDILAPSAMPRPGGMNARPAPAEALRGSLRPQTAPQAPSPEHDAAFAGIRNFDHVDGYTDSAAELEVDEVAFRSIQRRPDFAEADRARGPSLWQRLARASASLAGNLLQLGLSLSWLALIAAVTALAVGYALNPDDILGALKLGALPEQAQQLLGR
jgi:hypothetical protein